MWIDSHLLYVRNQFNELMAAAFICLMWFSKTRTALNLLLKTMLLLNSFVHPVPLPLYPTPPSRLPPHSFLHDTYSSLCQTTSSPAWQRFLCFHVTFIVLVRTSHVFLLFCTRFIRLINNGRSATMK